MSLGEIWAILRRRWYFMVPFTVLSLLGGAYLYATVPVSYQSQSSVGLLDSSAVARLAIPPKPSSRRVSISLLKIFPESEYPLAQIEMGLLHGDAAAPRCRP